MKHLAVALIVVALIGCDFLSDLWLNGTQDNSSWSTADTIGLWLAALWFFHHRDRIGDAGAHGATSGEVGHA